MLRWLVRYSDGQRSLTGCHVLGACMPQSSTHARSSAEALVRPRGLIDISICLGRLPEISILELFNVFNLLGLSWRWLEMELGLELVGDGIGDGWSWSWGWLELGLEIVGNGWNWSWLESGFGF